MVGLELGTRRIIIVEDDKENDRILHVDTHECFYTFQLVAIALSH